MGVVVRVQHVRPDIDIRVRTDFLDDLVLFRDAVAENMRHIRMPRLAGGACAARPDFVHAEEPFADSMLP